MRFSPQIGLALIVLLLLSIALTSSSGSTLSEEEHDAFQSTDSRTRAQKPPKSKFNASSKANDKESSNAGTAEDYEKEIKNKQEEAAKQKQLQERKKAGHNSVKRTLKAAIDDNCDWRSNPISLVRGELCGAHYKVLGINRRKDAIDKAHIKRAYRQMSLAVHPDKNPSEDAETAFKFVQDAYECLSSEECRESYDAQLTEAENSIQLYREELKEQITEKVANGLNRVYYHVSIASNQIYHIGMNVWDWAGELTYTFAGGDLPIGRGLLVMLGFATKPGHAVAFIFAIASMVVRWNIELAKSRGYF